MRRFEGGKHRFWEIRRDGATVRTRSGTIGTDGKAAAPKKCASPEKAEAEVARRVAEQLAKGYFEVTRVVAPEPSNPGLEHKRSLQNMDSPEKIIFRNRRNLRSFH
jgi:predicted DNA-binding WGR domain protein